MRAVVALFAAGLLACALPGAAAEKDKGKPHLELRSAPRFAFSPVNVLFTAELKGGGDIEQYYCPEVEWEWGDGGKSVQESDCPPFVAGETKIDRRFTNYHEYRRAGNYRITVSLRKADDTIAKTSVTLQVKPGIGDPTIEPEP
jgi:hypothetical protein